MVQRIGGFRRKTRHKLKKPIRRKGKISLKKFFQTFENGEKVRLNAEPAHQRGMYFPRFHNKVGVVVGKLGSCYKVSINDINKEKTVTVHPVHLQKVS